MRRKTTGVFLICYFAYVSIYVARLNLSMAAPALKELAVLTTAQIGFLGSMFSVVYACGRLLSGIIGDRTAPWKMISFGLILCGISNCLIGLFPPYIAFLLLWGVNAFAQSMLWGPILRILSAIYPEELAKKRASYMGTAVAAGNMAAILLNTELINRWGAQWAFLVPGCVTLVLCAFVLLRTRTISPAQAESIKTGYLDLLKNKTLQSMLIPAVIHGVMKDNISLWMTVYVMEKFGINLEQSAYFILLIPALGFVGRMIAPALFRFSHGQERPLLIGSYLTCAICSLLLILLPVSAWAAVIYLSLIYMAVSVINACMLAFFPIQFSHEGHVASVSGIMDFATYLGTGLSAMVYGMMIENWGFGSMYISWMVLSILAIPLLQNQKRGVKHEPKSYPDMH